MRSLEQWTDRRFALSFQHTINRTATMLQNFLGNKGCTMSTDENKAIGELRLGGSGEVKNFRHIREVVARESDSVRLPLVQDPKVVCALVGLQINHTNLMSALTGSGCYELEPERL